MSIENAVKRKIKSGKPSFGSWIMIGDLAVAEILSRSGFDWITVDMEHTPIGYETLTVLLAGIQGAGTEAFVRIEANDPVVIKKVLDCGVSGIIVPLINSREEAENAVKAAKYPPEGFRGVALGRASEYGSNFSKYFDSANERIIVIAQIEHYRAVENIEEIVTVRGLDGVFMGPYDLSGSMGIVAQFDHPRMKGAREKVVEAVMREKKILGIHNVNPDATEVKSLIDEGFNFIACSIDSIFLSRATRAFVTDLNLLLQQ